jgi:alkylhydroperoxidase family enzyme
MALRIPKAELAPEIAEPMTAQFGAAPEPLEVVSHNRKVAESAVQFSVLIGGWDTVAEDLKTFSHMAVAAQVGCSWCLDINYFQAQNHNLDMAKASQVPRWREADVFTSLERDVLEYSEAMTNTPPTVTDEMFAHLLAQLGPAAMVELTSFIAFANMATRGNVAQGIESQGFSAACAVPLATPVTRPALA